MIPPNKQAAVTKALRTAFGVTDFENIEQLTKGLSSALIFKITVQGNPYLLRVITRTDAMADPTYYFACMKAGAAAALAPPVYYLSIEDRISITGFIEAHAFPIPIAREKMAHLLQKLHALPKFPFRIPYFNTMEGFITKFQASNILPESATKELFELYSRIASIYPRNDQENWVSCHNDLKPENILYDGQCAWLVDWEGAFLNDRYLDLAVVANFVVQHEKDAAEFLTNYFGAPVEEYKPARLFVMSQLLHIYYFTIFMLAGSEGKPVNLNEIDKSDFRDFHDRMWYGKIDLADKDAKLQYAIVHMEKALANMHTSRLEDALSIISKDSKL